MKIKKIIFVKNVVREVIFSKLMKPQDDNQIMTFIGQAFKDFGVPYEKYSLDQDKVNDLLKQSEISPFNWVHYITDSARLSPYLADLSTQEGVLVVGGELPVSFLDYFMQNSILYINISIGPIRFLDDLTYHVSSNVHSMIKKLAPFSLKDEAVFAAAQTIRDKVAQATDNFTRDDRIKPNSLLVVLQKSYDTSVARGNGFYSFMDFINPLKEIAKDHDHIVILTHPNAADVKKKTIDIEKEIANAMDIDCQVISYNGYALLSNPNITAIAALNSSMTYEAPYFHKKAHRFLKFPFEKGGNYTHQNSEFTMVDNRILNPMLWHYLLNLKPVKIADILPLAPNTCRQYINGYWAYKPFMVSDSPVLEAIWHET